MKRLLLPLVLLFAGGSLFAQTPRFTERIDVRVANIDVVVVDGKGNIVTDLTADDFEILENGVPQPIVNFSSAAGAAEVATFVQTEGAAAEEAAPVSPRRLIFYIDNLTLTASRRNKLVEQMKDFAAEIMRPGDEAMVATFDQVVRVRQPFTSDLARIAGALESTKRDVSGGDANQRRAELTAIEIHAARGYADKLSLARAYAASMQAELQRSLDGATALVESLSGVDGKKAFIFASEALPQHPGREMFEFIDKLNNSRSTRGVEPFKTYTDPQLMQPPANIPGTTTPATPGENYGRALMGSSSTTAFQSAMLEARAYDAKRDIAAFGKTANASGITLYPLHAGSLAGGEQDLAGRVAGAPTDSSVAISARANTENAMDTIAELTGGVAAKGTDFKLALERIGNDLDSYYSLGYRPSGRSGERNVKVRLRNNSQKLQIRAKQTIVHKSINKEMEERVLANLVTPLPQNEMKLTITATDPLPQERGNKLVPVKILIPYESLLLTPGADAHTADIDVYIVATDSSGKQSPVVHRMQKIVIPADRIALAKGKSYIYSVNFLMNDEVDRVSVAVVDSNTSATSFARYQPGK